MPLLVDHYILLIKQRIAQKPAIPNLVQADSVPPEIITSASPCAIILNESPGDSTTRSTSSNNGMIWTFKLYLIEICPLAKLIKQDGIKKGEIFSWTVI